MGKRGDQEGSIRRRRDGRWEGRVLLGQHNGKQVRPSFYGDTRAEVQDEIKKAVREFSGGTFAVNNQLPVSTFLSGWLADVKPRVREKTLRSYTQLVELHLIPSLGGLKLGKLAPEHVQKCLNGLTEAGKSPRTVQYVRAVLRIALEYAVRRGAVSRNVAKLATVPRIPHTQVEPFTLAEAKTFLKSIASHRLAGLWQCAVWTGLRQGELLGLRWEDVDLAKKELRVRGALQYLDGEFKLVEPKTVRSRRSVSLPAKVVTLLKRHKVRQAKERLLAGADWDATWGLVFATRTGRPLEGARINRDLKLLLKKAELRPQRFHDLRHTCASLLLASGSSARMVMEWLGHSQIGITMNTYAHVMPAAKRESADKLAAMLG